MPQAAQAVCWRDGLPDAGSLQNWNYELKGRISLYCPHRRETFSAPGHSLALCSLSGV